MNCRRHGSKPTLALWMLVALADVAIVAAAAGPLTMVLIVAGLLVAAGALVTARNFGHRAPAPAKAVVRRRA
ncbi:hypothetical protein [Actinoplanes teichomyceticus]|uniref:Uncharacterized protein n=1 Tax=Actinoplanes teichomyceticus TaxID=1867 RepID=A0A561WPM9_ACTTI|nr:hypothetical protein [Actinoplanes teichomyceticus]TWG25793.1 hypothetical protein FHX34_101765 [Actinoplanes teichomyceticus]GIF10869.1 hypothetical protein Ate01nite_09010 [Actinoplanes teichomyceticus]